MSDEQLRRALAVRAYNAAAELLDQPELDADAAFRALADALASRELWSTIGTPVNLLIGDWQVARALCANGLGADAVAIMAAAVETANEMEIDEWLNASLHEGLARALHVAGDIRYEAVYTFTESLIGTIADEDDRAIIAAQFADLPRP
jgi:hypothetical protein